MVYGQSSYGSADTFVYDSGNLLVLNTFIALATYHSSTNHNSKVGVLYCEIAGGTARVMQILIQLRYPLERIST